MAANDGSTGEESALETGVRSHVRRRVGRACAELIESADSLRGLAAALEALAALQGSAEPEALRTTSVQARASALQAMLTGSMVAMASERLSTCAGVLELVGEPEG